MAKTPSGNLRWGFAYMYAHLACRAGFIGTTSQGIEHFCSLPSRGFAQMRSRKGKFYKPQNSLFDMVAPIIQTRICNLESRKAGLIKWKVPDCVKEDVLRFVEDLELGKVNRGRKISAIRQEKYIDLLRVPFEYFNKPMSQLTASDIEKFERALTSDIIQSRRKVAPYAPATKVDIRKLFKIFLRWRLGSIKAMELAGWLDTHVPQKTPDFLREQEVEQLFRHCRTTEQRYIVAVLFDSGARAEEFLNLRFEDIHVAEGKDNFVKITLKEEYSKTKGRTISLYWRHSLNAITEYLNECARQRKSPQDPVFQGTYDAMRMFLDRLGQRVLKRHIHPHLFRHSSATYYATKLNRQELCYRYGWRFSSNMPDVYISRAGMENRELDVKFTKTEIGDLKDDLTKMQQETKIKDDRIAKLESALTELQKRLANVTEVLQQNPSIADVEASLRRKTQSQGGTP